MLAEVRALHQEWRAAHERASRAENKLMLSLQDNLCIEPLEAATARMLRADASRRLRLFLAAAERASLACRVPR